MHIVMHLGCVTYWNLILHFCRTQNLCISSCHKFGNVSKFPKVTAPKYPIDNQFNTELSAKLRTPKYFHRFNCQ